MVFLEIRRKAWERAAREGGAADAAPVGAAPEPAPAPPSALAREGAGAADRAADAAPAVATDARFTTWRPGAGERPFIPLPEAPPPPTPAASDFAVFAPPRAPAAAEPQAAAAEPPAAPVPGVSESTASRALAPGGSTSAATPEDRAPPGGRPWPDPEHQRPALWQAPPERTVVSPKRAAVPPPPEEDPLDAFFFRPDEQVAVLGVLPAGSLDPESIPTEHDTVEEYLTFRLGTEEYGVHIGEVHEVLKAPVITEVPRAPVGILGVVTVRGEVVAVFDPRRRLGLPGAPPGEGDGRIVIVDDGAGPCGLLVDAVASVVRLARRAIEPCPQGIGGASADCLAGIGRERGRLFTVLDLPALLRRAPGAPRRAREGSPHDVA